MSAITVFPNTTYAIGSHAFASTVVPTGVVSATLALNRSAWSNAAAKTVVSLQISFNAGATWQALGGFTAQGGTVTNMTGGTETITSFTISLPQPANANRRVKGTFVVSGAAFSTSGTLTLT
jgi:hypothetical protein